MSESLRERVARALCPIILMHTDYSDVPTHEIFSHPRYAHLRERALEAADAAIAIVREEAAEKFQPGPFVRKTWYAAEVRHIILALKEPKP